MFVILCKSESSDDYGVIGKFDHDPTVEDKIALLEDYFGKDVWFPEDGPSEDDDGCPGFYGSPMHLTVQEI